MTKMPVVMALLLAAGFTGIPAAAQAVPSTESVLDKLFAYAAQYRAKLPSLECRESITTERVKKGKVTWTVRMEGSFQVTPDPARKGEFLEKRHFTLVDGKPRIKDHWKIPYFVNDGFANAIGFGHPEQRDCFDYALTSEAGGARVRLEMTAKRDLSAAHCADVYPSYRKAVLIDMEPFRIVRVERQLSAEDAKKHKEPFQYATEYGEQQFGQETLWLPVRATSHNEKDEGRLEIDYSDYHRFAGEVRIVPGETPEPVSEN